MRARGVLGLGQAELRDLLAAVDEAPHVTGRRVAGDDFVSRARVERQRPAAEDLEVVGMGPDG